MKKNEVNNPRINRLIKSIEHAGEFQPLTWQEMIEIVEEHYGNNLFKITQMKDVDRIKVVLRTGEVKTFGYAGLKVLESMNKQMRELKSFEIDEKYTCKVHMIEHEGKKIIKYSFIIFRNGEPCIYSNFHSERPLRTNEVKERIRLLFICRMINGYKDVDPDTIID